MSYATLCAELVDEDACVRKLQQFGVIPKSVQCAAGHEMKLYCNKGKGRGREGDVVWRWECNARSCRKNGKVVSA